MVARWFPWTAALLLTATIGGASGERAVAQPILPWFDRPPGPSARASCPASGEWALLYWSNTQTLAESTLYGCPGVDRLWTLADGRWLAYSRSVRAASDAFLVEMGQAAFLHGDVAVVQSPTTTLTPVALTPIELIEVTNPVRRGQRAELVVGVNPRSTCSAQFVDAALQPQNLSELGPRVSDDFGFIRWSWTVPNSTLRGAASVLVRCESGFRAVRFEVE